MRRKINMLEGGILKSIIPFALPIMLSSLLQYNYSLVDNIIVGRYVGTDALAAVGNVASINSFVIGAAVGLTSGFTIPVLHAYGAGDREKASHYAGSSIVASFMIGLVIVVVAHIVSTPLLRLIGTPDDIIGLSAAYVNILYFAVPIQMLSNNFTAISRAVGESKKPLYFFTVSVLMNFALDLLFVGRFGWGVEGAAAATFISHFATAAMTGFYVIKINPDIHIRLQDLKPDPAAIREQVKLGIPVSMQFTVTSIGSMCMQSAVNSFGKDVMAGFTAAGRVENLANIPLSGLGVANQTFVGQNYGARRYGRIIEAVRKIFILDVVLSLVMSTLLLSFGTPVVSLFMKETNLAVMAAAKRYLLATAQCFSLVAVLFVMRNSLQGMGYTYANAVAGTGELLGRISVAFIFSKLIGFNAVCYAAPAAWLLADIPLVIIYLVKRRRFLRPEAEKQSEARAT